jgi:hypothetical protein
MIIRNDLRVDRTVLPLMPAERAVVSQFEIDRTKK